MNISLFTSAHFDSRRRCIFYRCWRRGMREIDLILGSFIEKEILDLSEDELEEIELLLAEEDSHLFQWFMGIVSVPEHLNTQLFKRICNYCPPMNLL
ncbi:hypothetical protein B488_06820 [Liberibacter crescens BT-1]|uniref:FAD assembly factor SdhE n=1 Tax=Liberibacter crescens (strain BT-1) TaxID=1215343 RepID=L0ET16_LIBCB|nr:succinate dehydrogenase assembly factor 2 [Liberibacter crescens]AGA64674.1 hypothetical protein B488_06820 [Liberibacter crescens BT-1]AMC12775.1 hypothetical protein RL73_03500 [Liberibacter crescens]